MPNWKGPRYDAGWVYRRVAWGTWMEVGEYSNIESLSYSKAALNSLKLSGSASCDGDPPDEIDAVTAYYTFADGSGEVALVPVMTFLVESDEPQYSASDGGIARSSSLKFYSLLKVLSDIVPEGSLTIPAGTNAVAKAKDIAESVGLRTNNPSSTYTTSEDKTFGSDSTYLSIVNWLLDVAGYASARTDARGVVQMEPYVEPTDRPVSWTFRKDDDSTLLSGPSCENDWRSTPNVVTLEYQTESEYIIATARNIDPDSRASLPSRGWRTKSATVSVSELDGETPQARLDNLRERGQKRVCGSPIRKNRVRLRPCVGERFDRNRVFGEDVAREHHRHRRQRRTVRRHDHQSANLHPPRRPRRCRRQDFLRGGKRKWQSRWRAWPRRP